MKFKVSYIKSLNFKVLLLVVLIGVVPFTAAMPISVNVYKNVSIKSDAQDLLAQALLYNNPIVTTGYLNNPKSQRIDMELSAVADSHFGRILVTNSSLVVVKDTYGVDEGKTVIWEMIVKALKGESNYYFDENAGYLTGVIPLTSTDGTVVGTMIISKSMDYINKNVDVFMSYYLIGLVVVYVLSVAVAIWFSIRASKPIRKISKSLDDILLGYTNLLPEQKNYSELDIVVDKFNELLKRLHTIDESRQEFVSNVSHELKTPLTSMKVLADSLNAGEDVPLEMYKEFMLDIGDEIDRENKIINDLLALVKLDKSGASLSVSAVNMNELIELVLKRLKPIAEKADVEVVYESFRPVVCEIDEVKFTLVVTNLVENAIKYNNPGGWVHITLNSDHKYCFIKVEDNGLGIPEESVDFIFDRFYRADKSHSREIGGTGLGLAITKSAIVMHRGDIKVKSSLGEGSVFDVRIPLKYVSEEESKQ